MGLNALFQKIPIIILIKRTVQPADAIGLIGFKPGFMKYQVLHHVVESQLFTALWNRYHQ
jgi:hypothetical protein